MESVAFAGFMESRDDRADEVSKELGVRRYADEQSLLTLRVDRGMSWAEIAHILDEGAGEPALRKRFERVKRKLRDLAAAEGLLGAEER